MILSRGGILRQRPGRPPVRHRRRRRQFVTEEVGAGVLVSRMMECWKQLPAGETGLEDTAWTEGVVSVIGSSEFALQVPHASAAVDQVWNMQGVRYRAWPVADAKFSSAVLQHVVSGEDGWYGVVKLYGESLPYQVGTGEPGIHVSARNRGFVFTDTLATETHLVPAVVEEFEIPLLVSFRHQLLGSTNFGTHRVTVTHARAVVNDTPVGPITAIGHQMLMVDPALQPHTQHYNSGFNFAVERVSVPLDPDTLVDAGDIVGFDVWVQVEKYAATTVDTCVNPLHGIYNYTTVPTGHPSFPATVTRDWTDSWHLDYLAGTFDAAFDPDAHTFELDFGSASYDTPTGTQTWKMEGGAGWVVQVSQGRITADNLSLLVDGELPEQGIPPGSPSGMILLTWDGERPVLTFREYLETPAGTPLTALERVLHINYEPSGSGLYPDLALGGHRQCGEFHLDGVTVFKAKSAWCAMRDAGATQLVNPEFFSLDSPASSPVGDFVNLPDTITVTRVDQ